MKAKTTTHNAKQAGKKISSSLKAGLGGVQTGKLSALGRAMKDYSKQVG